jgi:hypothetical protein
MCTIISVVKVLSYHSLLPLLSTQQQLQLPESPVNNDYHIAGNAARMMEGKCFFKDVFSICKSIIYLTLFVVTLHLTHKHYTAADCNIEATST